MSDRDASWHEMAGSHFPQWLGHEPDEPLLDSILATEPLPPEAPHGMRVVAARLADLAAPAGAGTLAGEAVALQAFRQRPSPAGLPSAAPVSGLAAGRVASRRQKRARRLTAGRARTAGVLAALAVTFGGAAAAYADALPAAVQDFAHHWIGAPAAPGQSGHRAHGHTAGHHPGTAAGSPGTQHGKSHAATAKARHKDKTHPAHPARHPHRKHPPKRRRKGRRGTGTR